MPLPGHAHRPAPTRSAGPLALSRGRIRSCGTTALLDVRGLPPPSDLVPDSADAESHNSSQNCLELGGETRLTVQGG